jgi:hypothetical protein
VIPDRIDDEECNTFDGADRLKSDFRFVAGITAFEDRPSEYQAGEAEIKPPLVEVALALGRVPYQICGTEAPPYPSKERWHGDLSNIAA